MDFKTRVVRSPILDLEFEVLEGDTYIGPAVEQGKWEPNETALFRAHLEDGARVLDLGANIGWYAVQAVLAGCEVHSFEPVPAIAEVCRRNVERAMRKGRGRGVVHVCAAGAERGRAEIVLAPANHGDNRVVETGAQGPEDLARAERIAIEIERVDDRVQGPFRVLKVDTQGSEWLALQGAKTALAASQRLALLIEFWPYALRGAGPEELLGFLGSEGFEIGKATEAPYVMEAERILRQALRRDPVKGGLDLYGVRGGAPFHVLGTKARLHGMVRSLKEG